MRSGRLTASTSPDSEPLPSGRQQDVSYANRRCAVGSLRTVHVHISRTSAHIGGCRPPCTPRVHKISKVDSVPSRLRFVIVYVFVYWLIPRLTCRRASENDRRHKTTVTLRNRLDVSSQAGTWP